MSCGRSVSKYRCYDSDGTSVVVEVKQITHCSQAIGTVVLSSFVENKLHPLLNSMVPTMLVSK